ncbi:MAG: zinc-binding alcohol dehydrogenase [Halobacteriaceae archaeon]
MPAANPTVVFTEPGRAVVERRSRPTPDPDEVVVETERSLVSTGTELTVFSGDYPEGSHWDEYGTYPFVPGYCNVGTVVEAGDGADVAVDQRVVSRGAHARYVTVDADTCVPVPEGVSVDEAAFHTMAAVAMNGVRRSRLAWGEAVAVYGLGLLGQFAVRLARVAGARPVVGVDLAPERLDLAPDGVRTVDPRETDPADVLRAASDGRLADVTVEATGNPDAIVDELDSLRRQGRFVLLSSPRGETGFDFHDHCNWPSYEIVGAHDDSHPDVETPANPWTVERNTELFFRYVADGDLSVADLITHRHDVSEAPAVYDSLLADRTERLGVLFEWGE